ncbi:hypothetical protein GOZ78_02235 [Agrobacterium vitis]|uniref:Uncharacterized protein n=1 Tax=Agrobacterium vitis TaxID=373 RepID=A0ABD6GFD1_AGRVI|nr:hypothetical protein [Agrobacterium vitis]MUO77714.1 hypothetical protein [Agrobacterium vitis]MUO93231.1 hypothetical protein [Agrobacterium vitis]MUP04582.1 hypothetical protein [Agrobacterium vitis]MUZ80981.1 hypothetical protein [Agrobacterium vitis]MVA08834.1 hypothetical protein [Agrobacterium vitis]
MAKQNRLLGENCGKASSFQAATVQRNDNNENRDDPTHQSGEHLLVKRILDSLDGESLPRRMTGKQ